MFDTLFSKFPFLLGPLKDKISEADYFAICQLNECLLIERNSMGDWEIQSLSGARDSSRSVALTAALARWADKDGTGVGFGALTGFTLPNGAVRAPDVAWLRRERWDALTDEQKEGFAPACPDFLVEMRSWQESLGDLQTKLAEYLANGLRLGWLIDPQEKRVHIYRPGAEIEILDNPATISGEPVLKGFVLNLSRIWGANSD